MSITFGNVGDIIAVGQIAWSLAKALADSKESAKEYQSLIKELQTFDQALLQTVALWQNYESSPELEQLGTIMKDAVKDWRDILLAFRVKVDKKYSKSLVGSGSGNWVKDASKKVIWLKEKEDILDLKRKLRLASDTITILTLAAIGKSNRLAESNIACRVQAVHCLLEQSKKLAEEHVTQLKIIDKEIEIHSKTSDLILGNVKSCIMILSHVYAMTIEIKNILGLFQSHIASQQSTPQCLGAGWQQDPITLEDALGFRIPLPLELVNSWDMLDVILLKRFEKRPGHQKILQGEFAIEEGVTGRDITRKHEFYTCVRPGQKIDMSMVFSDLDANSNHCPRCGTKSGAEAATRTQCTSCQMWFQRLVEIGDSELEAIVERTERSAAIQSDARIKMPKIPVSTPADFQRVRLMSTLRIREQKKKEERDRMFEDFAKMDALEWTGNWDQSVANLPFTDFDNMMSRPRSPIFQSDVSQQLIGSLAANRMVNDSRDNEERTGIETERNDRLKSGNLYHNAPTIPFKSPPRLRDLASRRKTVKVEAPAMTKGIFNRARGAGREGSDGVDVLATTGLGGLARKKNEGMDDKNEYSDMEIRNVGIELNERLRAAVAQRMTGYTAMDMKDEWECWLKDAVEAGGLRILSSDLSPNTSVSGIGQVTNNKLAMHPRFLDAAQLGQWQQIPDFLHNIVR